MDFLRHSASCRCEPEGVSHVSLAAPDPGPRASLRLLTLNLRHGRGAGPFRVRRPATAFAGNLRRVAEFISACDADLVALQEADAECSWSGGEHQVRRLAEGAGFSEYVHGIHFTACRREYQLRYGTALLSRVPLGTPRSVSFHARPLDSKGYVSAVVDLEGEAVKVVSVHLDPLHPVRRRQVGEMIRDLKRSGRPIVVLGDLNSTGRHAFSITRLLAEALDLSPGPADDGAPTFPALRPRRRLDWILVSRGLAVRRLEVPPDPVSDHLAVAAEVSRS